MISRSLLLGFTLALAACGGSPTAPSAPAPNATPLPQPTADPAVLRSATFRGAFGHSASGTARIVQIGGEYRMEFLDDFRVDTGSIDVYLARKSDTVDMNRDLNLGAMKSRTCPSAPPTSPTTRTSCGARPGLET